MCTQHQRSIPSIHRILKKRERKGGNNSNKLCAHEIADVVVVAVKEEITQATS